ncbi:hypothetical protein [Bradyrhizobium sp. USDA 4486]
MSISETIFTGLLTSLGGQTWIVRGLAGATVGALLGGMAAVALPPLFKPKSEKASSQATGPVFNGPIHVGPGGAALNSGTINNVFNGPQRLSFTNEVASSLLEKLPPGKPIRLRSIGSASDHAIAEQYGNYLTSHGFQITNRDIIGTLSPPPEESITVTPGDAETIVQIAPQAH